MWIQLRSSARVCLSEKNKESSDLVIRKQNGKMEVKAGFMSLFVCLLWITVVVTNVAAVNVCPDKCVCQDTTIRCTRRQLVSIPELPDDTTIM